MTGPEGDASTGRGPVLQARRTPDWSPATWRARHEPDQIAEVLDSVQLQAAQVREQQVGQAGILGGQLMMLNRPPRPPRC